MSVSVEKGGCIVFTGGGTGGHIFPGLAVADELSLLTDVRLVWIGSSSGMDRSLIEKDPLISRFIGVPSGKLRRYFSLKNLSDAFKIFAGFCASLFHLHRLKPALVFSKGGFVSVPVCYAAFFLGIPVYTHECDFSPGLATRLNAGVASRILVSFADTPLLFSEKTRKKVTVTGNPVRPVFYTADAAAGLRFLELAPVRAAEEKPLLFVCGGSSGARQINDLVISNLDWLCTRFTVVHQTGANFSSQTIPDEKKGINTDYHQYAFIYGDMPHVLAAADVVLSRAGSNSLWENAVTGKAMILLPLTGSGTRGDQVENAAFFAEKNAALVLTNEGNPDENLREALDKMLDTRIRSAFSSAAKALVSEEKPASLIARLIHSEAGV